jgi:hypothetical protein
VVRLTDLSKFVFEYHAYRLEAITSGFLVYVIDNGNMTTVRTVVNVSKISLGL